MQSKISRLPQIKICGLKDSQTIQHMHGLAINYIGLVFAPSKRQVSILEGKQLVSAIHLIKSSEAKPIEAVAVCVDMPIVELKQLIVETKVDIVQLHGNEDVSYIAECKVSFPNMKLWKAISIKDDVLIEQQIHQLSTYIHLLDAVVIDAPGGGTGKVFNWEAINSFREITRQYGISLFVAGGLHADNVELLLAAYEIDGVDVSSGVETDGVKDILKIKRFVGKVINDDTNA